MKYKLSDRLNAFLNDNVLPKRKDEIKQHLLDWVESGDGGIFMFAVEPQHSVYGFFMQIKVTMDDFEIVSF